MLRLHPIALPGCALTLMLACSDDAPSAQFMPSAGRSGSSGMSASGAASGGVGNQSGSMQAEGGAAGDAAAGALGMADAGAGGEAGRPEPAPRFDAYPPSPYPPENPDSDAKAMLGKILFWEEQLSGDNTVACGTCHRPNAGGSDPRSSTAAAALDGPDGMPGTADDVHGSIGVVRCNNLGEKIGTIAQVTGRKAPTYLDAMFAPRLFWDGRAECSKPGCPSFSAFEDPDNPGSFVIAAGAALENQAVGPPMSDVEMSCEQPSWSKIHDKLETATPLVLAKQIPKTMADFIADHGSSYPELFAAAFGNDQTSGPADEINTRRIAFAIATHERRLRSDLTPWDRWNAGDDDALTPEQVRGFELFMDKANCERCHRLPTFSDGDFHFIGFHKPTWDLGRQVHHPFAAAGAMRTPTLRNVGLREATGLLHNGAGPGSSMEEVVELYDKGGLVDDPDVVAVPISASIKVLDLTEDEKADLIDFLRNGLDDPRALAQQPPFDRPLLSTE